MVKTQEEPKQFDDLAEPNWKNKLIAEPRDVELLVGLAKHKFKNDERAIALLRRFAANSVEFHKGHSELTELLTAGRTGGDVSDLLRSSIPGTNKKRHAFKDLAY